MTTSQTDTEAVFGGWDTEKLVEELASEGAGGTVYRVVGVSPSALQRDLAHLRRELAEHDRLALALDAAGGPADGESFRAVTTAYAREVRQRGRFDDEAGDLVDFLASARETSSNPHHPELSDRAFKNALCRLWRSLSDRMPATLFVFHGADSLAADREALTHFVREFFVDPVAELAPELGEPNRLESSLVFAGDVPDALGEIEALDVETIDVSERARETIRERLTSENVVDQFIASTGGDPRQLEVLLESLPEDYESFWSFRYRELERPQQRIVELLAVAGEPVSIECLRRAADLLELGGDFSRHVQWLTDEGFVDRRIDAGTVQLQLEDGAFRRGLREELDDSDRAVLHGVVAEAALESQLQDATDRFLAEHFLEAGRIERGFEFGMRAARKLHGEYAFGEARELFEQLLECAPSEGDAREIRNYLLDVHAALGNGDRALEHAQALKESIEDSAEWGRIVCEEGKIRVQSGDYEAAERDFQSVCEELDADEAPGVRAAAIFGRAESRYMQGRHDEAEELVDEAIERLEGLIDEHGRELELERTLVLAKNLKGRLAIFRGALDEARPLFESNYSVAQKRGWDREKSRAEINLGVIELGRGDYAAALRTLRELKERNPGPEGSQRTLLLINLGAAAQHEGDYESALEHYRDALREARRANFDYGTGLAAHNLAAVLEDLGAYEECIGLLDRLERRQLDERRNMFTEGAGQALRAKALMERGEAARALEVLDAIDDDDGEVGAGTRAHVELHSILSHVELGQLERAEALLEGYERPEEPTQRYCLEGSEHLARARVAMEHSDWESAEDLARRASEELRDRGYFQDAVRASLIRVRALSELERCGEAESLVDRRLTDYHDLSQEVPESYRDRFFSIPAYRKLVEYSRELLGETPDEFQRYVDTDEADGAEHPEPSDEAYRKWRGRYGEIVGEDERLLKIFRRIDQLADSDSPVLIQGDSGTGKELIADAIHRQGTGSEDEPFVKVNCGAFVDNLLLSELFGHEKGAFTGAVEEKVGRFERADGGTIFLDEVGEISKKAQVALLRVLQEGEFERVGGTETRSVDVRVICATNRDLETAVENGEFRLDLFYRLKGVLLELPALRERKQDIPRLVRHFARDIAGDDEEPAEFDRDVMEFLASYSWPGNIRELKNFVRSILLFVDGETVEMRHLRDFRDFFSEGEVDLDAPEIDYDVPAETYEETDAEAAEETFEDPENALVREIVADGRDLSELKERIEYESIRRALRETGGNITQAAEILQMTRPRLSQIVNADDDLVELKDQLVG